MDPTCTVKVAVSGMYVCELHSFNTEPYMRAAFDGASSESTMASSMASAPSSSPPSLLASCSVKASASTLLPVSVVRIMKNER